MKEDLEEIADKISALIDRIKAINVQVYSVEEFKLGRAVEHLLEAEDKVRFLL